MIIKWHGLDYFLISIQKSKTETIGIIINPFLEKKGFHLPKNEANIVIFDRKINDKEKKMLPLNSENIFLITDPGEYDLKGISIQGVSAKTKGEVKTVIYKIEGEGIKICYLGRIGEEEFSPEQTERIGDVDVLIIPIGGKEAVDAKGAFKLMSQIEPKITIPMYYQTKNGKEKDLGKLDDFLKSLGIKQLPPLPKLSLKERDLPKDEAKIIILEP